MKTREEKILMGIWIFMLALGLGTMAKANAAYQPISCKTNFGEKSFTIQGETVAFHQERHDGRSISSVLSAKTQLKQKGFKKTIYKEGFKHLIYIENKSNFSSDNDFLAVTSPKGHKMTFPINCSR